MKIQVMATLLLLILMTACGGSGSKTNTPVKTVSNLHTLSGVAQKGPAQPNASITLYELDHKAKRTGRKLTTKTIGKQGAFAFQIPKSWGDTLGSFAEIIFIGHFFNESIGEISANPVQLSAFTLLNSNRSNQVISINILTTLLHFRTKNLIAQGHSFSVAQQSAATSLQNLMGVVADIARKADLTRLSYPKENSVLLFLSGAIAELSQHYNTPVQRIIDQIATDFAMDGQLSGLGAQWEQRLQQMAFGLETNKTEKYSAYLQNHLGKGYELLPNASHLPKQIRITSRPVADAGADQIVPPSAVVNLSGLKSHDVDGGKVDYAWFQTDQNGSAVTLNNRLIASPQFKAPNKLDQTLWFTLVVTDKNKVTDTDTIKISTAEVLPTIDNLPEVVDKKGNTLKDSILVKEGGTITFSLFVNNPVKKGLHYSLRSLASNGTVQFPAQGAGEIDEVVASYQHNGSETQADVFEFEAKDDRNNAVSRRINVVVTPVNDTPVGVDDQVTTFMNHGVNIAVLSNDTDPESDSLSVVGIVIQPTHGKVDFNNGVATYLPNKDFLGTDSFDYQLTDGDKTTTANVFITVNDIPNKPPIANNDASVTRVNQPVVINVLANDSDPDKDNLTVLIDRNADHGTTQVNINNLVIYTPDVGFSGNDSFTYTLSDGRGGEDTATVSIIVTPNQSPIAVIDLVSTNENESIDISVLENDSDPDGNKNDLAISSFTNGIKGAVTQKSVTKLTYTPNMGETGEDHFTYTIVDKDGGTATANVKITINSINKRPQAVDDSATTTELTLVNIPVLDNDSDPDNDALSITFVGTPQHGITNLKADKTIDYTPEKEFSGTDTFTYIITDGKGLTASATVTVSVNTVNKAPVALDDSATTMEITLVNIPVLANDSDPDNDVLIITFVGTPQHGIANLKADKTIDYTPEKEFSGADTFTYIITDGKGLTASATVTVSVNAVNKAPIALDDSATTMEVTLVNIPVLANDSDPDNDALSITFVGAPQHGIANLKADKTIDYTPEKEFSGTDTFTYIITDGKGFTASATVTVSVNAVNKAPVALDDSATTMEITLVNIPVLANDSDPDNDALSITFVGTPQHGTANLKADKTIDYTPEEKFLGTDTFTYAIANGKGLTASAIVTITVNATPNQSPKIASRSIVNYAEGREDIVLDIQSIDDNDSEGNGLYYDITGGDDKALFGIDASTGELTFNATPDFENPKDVGGDNTYTIEVTVFDSEPLTDTQSIQIIVTNVIENTAPTIISPSSVSYAENGNSIVLNIQSIDDNDSEGNGLYYDITGGADQALFGIDSTTGELTFNTSPDFENPADADGNNIYDLQVTVFDREPLTDAQEIKVTVTNVQENTAPVAVDDEYQYQVNVSTVTGNVITDNSGDNDFDPDGDPINVVPFRGTLSGGFLDLRANGRFIYSPPTAISIGNDTYVYTLKDSHNATDTATITFIAGT
ncbi:MAG TPA: tandem-95 repeat protein [Leucothrix mucor]|uniref:Tandem-95 repeat protein n=1 Tax=Leucothrix mucor TaxID=45248 RepID=A0A7V2T1X7_LEUMU|nr:tandem-95 repeat protein [Leucothrix mucor]